MNKQKELQKLVAGNPHFEFLPNGKIKCTITGHELLPTLDDFQRYLLSKSYKNGIENDFDFSQFEPYVVENKKNRNKMYCNLTRQVITKKKSSILKHVNGKRYKHYLQIYLDELAKLEDQQVENAESDMKADEDIQDQVEFLENLQEEEEGEKLEKKETQHQKNKKFIGNQKNKIKKNKSNKPLKQAKDNSILKKNGNKIKKNK